MKINQHLVRVWPVSIAFVLALLPLVSTELGLLGSGFLFLGIFIAYLFSGSIQNLLISTTLSLAIYSILVLITLYLTNDALSTQYCLALFVIVNSVVTALCKRVGIFQSKVSNASEFLTLLPVIGVVSYFSFMISKIEDTTAARLSWLGFIGEDNAAWVGAFSFLSPLRDGGVTLGNTGGGGPYFVAIGALVDGLQSLSGLNLKADIAPLSVINLYSLTFTFGVLAATSLAVSIAKIVKSRRDLFLEFCVAATASVSTYLLLATMAKIGHLATIMAVSATFTVLLTLLVLDTSPLNRTIKLIVSLIALSLLPGLWYPLAFVAFFFTLFLCSDAIKRFHGSRDNLKEVTLLVVLILIGAPVLASTLFSTGDVNPLRYLTFEGGVVQLSPIAYALLATSFFFSLMFSQRYIKFSTLWSNLIISISINLSVLWLLTYILPFANGPKYAVYKLSLVTLASLMPIAIALLVVYLRQIFDNARVFTSLVLLLTIIPGAITPELASYKFGFNYVEYRWAKPLVDIVNDSPNKQVLCLAGFDGMESYLCTRFAAVLTGDGGNLSVSWRAASIDLLPENLWEKDLIDLYNQKFLQDKADIQILLIDLERDVKKRYPWYESLLN